VEQEAVSLEEDSPAEAEAAEAASKVDSINLSKLDK
jgi:hypothetical protein